MTYKIRLSMFNGYLSIIFLKKIDAYSVKIKFFRHIGQYA